MRVIICGAGQVGWQIARHLSGERNDVTVVDYNADLVRRATDTLEVRGVTGFASHPEVLARAEAKGADMLIAATYSDEVNIVTCQVAHSVFEVRTKIARLRSQAYLAEAYTGLLRSDHMPIDVVISPELEVAEAALHRLAIPAAFDTESFLDGEAELTGLVLDEDCPVVNTPLRQLSELFSTLRAVVVGVRRNGALFAPTPDDQLFEGDEVYIFEHGEDTARTLEIFGKKPLPQERVVIVGGGNVGLTVAKALEARKIRTRTRVIERDRDRAERAADALERTVVLNGDGLNMELLSEAGIERADAVLAVTDDDKTNILTSIRAKSAGARMAICLFNDPTLSSLMAPLNIDAYINPRAMTVSSILRHVRRSQVHGVYSIGDAEAEVIEAKVPPNSRLAGRLVREAGFPEGALVGAVRKGGRDGKIIRPSGETKIEEGDDIVVFAMADAVAEVDRLLQGRIKFH